MFQAGMSSFPLGLGGLMSTWTPPQPTTFKDQEDYVRKLIEDLDDGVLALVYKSLHAIGYRIDGCQVKIDALRKKLEQATP